MWQLRQQRQEPCRHTPPTSKNGSTRSGGLLALLAAACLTLAGCSMVRTGYDNFPMLAMWQVGNYLPLEADQRRLARARIDSLHLWHRDTQLGDYSRLLHTIRDRVAAGPVDAVQIGRWRRELIDRWGPIAEKAAPGVAELAVTLKPAQLEKLRGEIERSNEKYRKEWLPSDPADRIKARTKRFVERAEMFVGRLSDSQRRIAREAAAGMPDTSEELRFAQRQARQKDLAGIFGRIAAERPTQATAERWIREHLAQYWRPADSGREVDYERSMAASDAMMAAMLAEASPAQRRHFQDKLQEWIDMVDDMRGSGRAQAAAAPNS